MPIGKSRGRIGPSEATGAVLRFARVTINIFSLIRLTARRTACEDQSMYRRLSARLILAFGMCVTIATLANAAKYTVTDGTAGFWFFATLIPPPDGAPRNCVGRCASGEQIYLKLDLDKPAFTDGVTQ